MSLVQWAERRLGVVKSLAEGQCGGSYYDAALMLAATLSGLAAHLWPGEHFNRCRFVEAWVRFGPDLPEATRISLPVLRRWLQTSGRLALSDRIADARPGMFGAGRGRVLTGEDVDMSEHEVGLLLPELKVADVRRYSYPAVFYKYVRSPLTHEGKLADEATPWPMTRRSTPVSYANMLLRKKDVRPPPLLGRWPVVWLQQIHFDLGWLTGVVRHVAMNIEGRAAVRSAPPIWWLEAGPDGAEAKSLRIGRRPGLPQES